MYLLNLFYSSIYFISSTSLNFHLISIHRKKVRGFSGTGCLAENNPKCVFSGKKIHDLRRLTREGIPERISRS